MGKTETRPKDGEQYQHDPAVKAAVGEQAWKNVALIKKQAAERQAKRFKKIKRKYKKKDLARAMREAAEEEAREANEVASAYAKKAASEGAEAARAAAQQMLAPVAEGCCEAACDAGLGECLCLLIEPACECFLVGFCEHVMFVPDWMVRPLLECVKCTGKAAGKAALEAAKFAQKKLRERAARDLAKRMRKAVQKTVQEQLAQAAAIGDIDLGMDAPDVQQLLLDAQELGLDAEAIVAEATAAAREAVAAAAESLSSVREAFQTKFRGRLGEAMRKRQALLERADKAMFDNEYEAMMVKVRQVDHCRCWPCCTGGPPANAAEGLANIIKKETEPGEPGWNEGPYGVHVRPDTLHHFVDMDSPDWAPLPWALGAAALGAGAAALGGVVTQQPLPSGSGSASLDDFVGQRCESFPNGQPGNIVETFQFTREGAIYVTTGTSTGRNTFTRRGETLHNQQHPHITATLRPNGELAWSHGYGSRICGGGGAAALGGVVTQQPLPSGAGGAVGRGARVAPAPPEPSPETMVLTVPAGWTPGTPLRVQTPRGRTLDVAVPAGLDPGAEFRVTVAAEPGSAFCTKCGTALSPGTNSCVKCDGPQPSSCTKCGASVAPDAKFCSSCGAAQP